MSGALRGAPVAVFSEDAVPRKGRKSWIAGTWTTRCGNGISIPLFIEGMPYSKPKIGGHPNKVVHVRDETAQFEINGAVAKVLEEHGRFRR